MNKKIFVALLAVLVLGGCTTTTVGEREDTEEKRLRRVQIHTDLGAAYMMRGRLDVALQELERALELNANDSQANHYMGLLQFRLKNREKGENYLRRAISLNPENAEARNTYGVILCEQGKFDDADEQFQAALKVSLYQSSDEASANAGLCKLKKADRRAANTYFRQALIINPKHPAALINLARLSYEDADHLAARGFMQRYLEVAKETPEVLLLAFRIERALGAKDAQARIALKLRGNFPDSAEVRELRSITGYK
jgi:type IV pilus assembly protein PilF